MPKYNRIIPEVMTHLIHPISEQLTARLLATLGVDRLFDDNLYYNADDSKASKTTDSKNRPKLDTDVCLVDIEHHMNPAEAKWSMQTFKHAPFSGISNVYKFENQPVFYDKKAEILLIEQNLPCWVHLNFEMRFKSKEVAYTTLDTIRNKYFNSSIVEYQDIVYNYPLDHHLLIILHRLYKMRQLATPLTFKEYLEAGSRKGISYDVSRTGKDTEIVIQKNQFRVLTEVTCDMDRPEPENQDNVPKHWKVTLAYDFQFTRPSAVQLNHPAVIDNVLVDAVNIQDPGRQHPTLSDAIGVDIDMQQYIYKRYVDMYPHQLVRFPHWDDWNIPEVKMLQKKRYVPFFLGAITLDDDPDTGETVSHIDLINDFPDEFKLHPIIVDALKIQARASFGWDVLFNVSVYANEMRVDESLLELSDDLVLTIKSTMKDKRYHLVFSELISTQFMHPRYVPILLKFKDFFGLTILRNLKRLVEAGELYIDKGIIKAGKDLRLYAPGIAPGYMGLPEGENSSILGEQNYGAEYSDLEGYTEDVMDEYIYTRKGYPILSDQGGNYGFISPFRIGKFVIEPRRERVS